MIHFEEYLILKGFTKKTAASFCRMFKAFEQWTRAENIPLTEIAYTDVLAYIAHCKVQGNKQRTVQQKINAVNHYYRHLQYDEIIQENPCSGVQLKGIKRKTLCHVLSKEQLEQIYQNYQTEIPINKGQSRSFEKPYQTVRSRNKLILGLLIYQGIRTEEIAKLTLSDVNFRAGKIKVAGGRRSNERSLKLESFQVLDLMDYIPTTRKEILQQRNEKEKHPSEHLFLSSRGSASLAGMMGKLIKKLYAQNSCLTDIRQIRTSVITHWLKLYNLRQVQYMAGHRYVSSTEAYQVNNMEELQEDIHKFHPTA